MKKTRYRINNIKLNIKEDWSLIPRKIEKICGLPQDTLGPGEFTVRKESIDAREQFNIRLVYTVDFSTALPLRGKGKKNAQPIKKQKNPAIVLGQEPLTGRPVVVGFGPCGLFAALYLAEAGYAPIVLERGGDMVKRVKDVVAFWTEGHLNPESNVLFGEGGAGTFSDGKLTTGTKDPRIRRVLEAFVQAGAPEDILYKQKPHIGTDVLRAVVVTLRRRIEAAGGEIRFNTKVTGLQVRDSGEVCGVEVLRDGKESSLSSSSVILALGHSARDTFAMLKGANIPMEQKPFSIGVRMEHPQALIDHSQYGDTQGLPAADYKLSYRGANGRGVYSFCMCPGGEVITASTQPGLVCVNGMSNRARNSGTANAGILCDVRPSDFESEDVLAGIAFQEHWEGLAYENGGGAFKAPTCSWKDFQEATEAGQRVRACLPEFAVEGLLEAIPVFGKRIVGFDGEEARLTAVETRSSSPVRILRGGDYQSTVGGLYPAGEGAGYAGGITSAACDGLRVAESVVARFAPPVVAPK